MKTRNKPCPGDERCEGLFPDESGPSDLPRQAHSGSITRWWIPTGQKIIEFIHASLSRLLVLCKNLNLTNVTYQPVATYFTVLYIGPLTDEIWRFVKDDDASVGVDC